VRRTEFLRTIEEKYINMGKNLPSFWLPQISGGVDTSAHLVCLGNGLSANDLAFQSLSYRRSRRGDECENSGIIRDLATATPK
jgi:hypothetical protein